MGVYMADSYTVNIITPLHIVSKAHNPFASFCLYLLFLPWLLQIISLVQWFPTIVYHKATEPLNHSCMYSLVSLSPVSILSLQCIHCL